MNVLTYRSFLPGVAIALGLLAPAAAQNIYKCPQPGGGVAYTDHPCRAGNGELLHKADDSEVIDRYLRLGQDQLARQYADARHLGALYKERLAAYQQAQEEKARRQHEQALVAQQRDEAARQQARQNQIAERNRLEAENDALRQQNDQYRDELARPVPAYAPAYWGVAPAPYWRRSHHHDRDPDSRRAPPRAPVYQLCTQLAGGRVKC
ncbi:MAG: DUF4124 domain-containing protein [Rhodanobacter sp.]|nr:MAG: DUF4124 domain-containing protein [Rhodanobacter sp.]TAM06805.1 MAG: DUF4124 domain-containing protein [Rhodanobacter sp.]TAM40028.1 MAG: DUF4124 domain-containing protein [Rhodanobacter sp.]